MSTQRPRKEEKGFTLVELLLVMLIIAILAAVAIPVFLDQEGKAKDSAAVTQISTAYRAIEIYGVANGTYCMAEVSDLVAIAPMLSQANGLTVDPCGSGNPNGYTITVNSASQQNTQFELMRDSSGDLHRTCSPAGQGGCHADGTWG